MPLPGWLARVNRRITNRVTGPVARLLPGFAVVTHTGRRSGRRYRTPVNFFRSGARCVIALTYGPDRDWVKNVLVAGACQVETGGTTLHLAEPRIVEDERLGLVPAAIRPILRAIDVHEFMLLKLISSREGGHMLTVWGLSKSAANYRPASRPAVSCGDCAFMFPRLAIGGCRYVRGVIRNNAVCDRFAPRRAGPASTNP